MENTEYYRKFAKWNFYLCILIILNIFFGPAVRATSSGLACPDWPLCYGKVIPPFDFRIWMEVGHRIYSGIIGFVFLFLFFIALKNKPIRKNFLSLYFTALLFLINQVVLGMLTVTKLLDPTIVNFHYLNAILFLTVIATTSIKAFMYQDLKISQLKVTPTDFFQLNKMIFLFGILLIFLQLFLGGRVSSHYAGLACPDFPACNGIFFPKSEGLIKYQMEHRYGAYLLLIVLPLCLTFAKKTFDKKSFVFLKASLHSLLLQIALGVLNVLFQLPVLITSLHSATGAIVFICFYSSLYRQILAEKKIHSDAQEKIEEMN